MLPTLLSSDLGFCLQNYLQFPVPAVLLHVHAFTHLPPYVKDAPFLPAENIDVSFTIRLEQEGFTKFLILHKETNYG